MSVRTDPVLRFPFDEADQARMDTAAGAMSAADAPVSRDPANAAEPPVGIGLNLQFRITNASQGAPSIRPLGPCRLTFIADPSLPMPPANTLFAPANYSSWPTRGVLCAELLPPTSDWINQAQVGVTRMPTTIWYDQVDIPLEFLQQTLARRKQKIPSGGGFPTVAANAANWANHAATRFLRGRFSVELRLGTTPADDDAVKLPMPRAVMNDDASVAAFGEVKLMIVAGRRTTPFDGPVGEYAGAPGSNLHKDLPQYPRAGLIPARMVLRELRAHLIGGAAGQPLADKALGPVLNYRQLDVTRTWQNGDECSVYFPRHVITLAAAGATSPAWSQWLPDHGTIFIPEKPGVPSTLKVSLERGDMRWLVPEPPGGTPAWRRPAEHIPADVDFSAGTPHVIARLPMQVCMTFEKRHNARDFAACTYYSLRRTMRAFADNRICGGRLNYDEKKNAKSARELLASAWGSSAGFFPTTPKEQARDPETKQTVYLRDHPELCVAYGAPSPVIRAATEITDRNNLLALVMQLFWPDPAPQHPVSGASLTQKVLTRGEVYFALWQSKLTVMHHPDTRRNFAAAHVSRGAPGAMVAAGAASYVGDHNRKAGETDDAWSNRVTQELLLGFLQPGALLQFWSLISDFAEISRSPMPVNNVTRWDLPGLLNASTAEKSYGHSPVFWKYTGNPTGEVFKVIDQNGENGVLLKGTTGALKLQWWNDPEQVWIAANWNE